MKRVEEQRKRWHSHDTNSITINVDESILQPRVSNHTYRTGGLFLIVSVDKKIMKDHDGIANQVIINFPGEHINWCRADPPEPTK